MGVWLPALPPPLLLESLIPTTDVVSRSHGVERCCCSGQEIVTSQTSAE